MFRRYVPRGYAEIRIDEYNAWKALLTGQIVDVTADGPGTYTLDGKVTVIDFIYGHGGPTPDAALGDVRILRGNTEIPVLARKIVRSISSICWAKSHSGFDNQLGSRGN